jgi:hypothetical protein
LPFVPVFFAFSGYIPVFPSLNPLCETAAAAGVMIGPPATERAVVFGAGNPHLLHVGIVFHMRIGKSAANNDSNSQPRNGYGNQNCRNNKKLKHCILLLFF